MSQKNSDLISSSSRQKSHASPPSIRTSITTHPNGITHAEGSRVLELRLMHHYTTSTCKQLPDGHSRKGNYVWSIDIPKLAFQSDLVLSALLSISALHHWALTPNDQLLSYAAGYYFDRAVRDHRKALGDVDQVSAEVVLATAILITHQTWLAAHNNTSNTPYELPLQTYYMARGIQVLFEQMWPWLGGSGYLWYVDRTPISDTEEVVCVDPFLISSQYDLAKLSVTFNEEGVSPKDKIVYEKTVGEISSMCLSICNRTSQVPLQRMVATMPLRLPERFLELVELKDPRALALLARNLALLKVIDSVWWLHGTGPSQNVAEISVTGIGNMIPEEWFWVMEWPLKVLSGDLRPLSSGTT